MFTVARERLWLIGLRQAWNISKSNATRLSSRTVLFLSAPKDALDNHHISKYFGEDAVRVWPATKADKLSSLVSERNSQVEQLESAEMSSILSANKKGITGQRKSSDRNANSPSYDSLPNDVKRSLRPTHRLKKEKPVGKQVDSIDYYREKVRDTEAKLEKARQSYNADDTPGAAAVFVEFRTLAAAQKAYQQVASSDLLSLSPRFTSVLPGDVIWSNLTISPARRISQQSMATALVVALIVFWFIPVSIVGALSNVSYLAEHYEWLSFLNKLPDVVMALLTGLVPPLLTSLLSKYVPNIFRCKFQSITREVRVNTT
jgi:hypothetical protein